MGAEQMLALAHALNELPAADYLELARVLDDLSFADELEVAHSSLHATACKPSHGPIAGTVVFGQLARIGQPNAQHTAIRGCRMGLYHLWLEKWMLGKFSHWLTH